MFLAIFHKPFPDFFTRVWFSGCGESDRNYCILSMSLRLVRRQLQMDGEMNSTDWVLRWKSWGWVITCLEFYILRICSGTMREVTIFPSLSLRDYQM